MAEPIQRPSLGRIVLVTTHGNAIGGQSEHAAIVTKVVSDLTINVTLFPGTSTTLYLASVPHETAASSAAHTTSWRWPPRV